MQPIEPHKKTHSAAEKAVVSEFFGCLKSIEARISSKKKESASCFPKAISAHVDKLNITSTESIPKEEVIKYLARNGFQIKNTYLHGNHPFLSVGRDNGTFFIPSKPYISAIITNPSKFKNWASYTEDAKIAFSLFDPQNLKVTRLDLAIDYSCHFSDLRNDLLVRRVGSKSEFTEESFTSSKGTGVRYGKKPRQIELYDYSLKHSLPEPITRLEERLYNAKIPIKKWEDIPQILTNSMFKGVTLERWSLPISIQNLNEKTVKLKNLIETIGYMETRKKLNSDGNFERDFKKFMTSQAYKFTPEQSFKQLIKPYFKQGDTNE